MSFQPSRYSYGEALPGEDAGASGGGGGGGGGMPSQDIISSVRTFFFGEESRQQAAVTEAEIRNLQAQAENASGFMRTYYLNRIAKKQAQLEVLRAEAAESEYAEKTWAVGRTALAVSAVLGVLVVSGIAMNQFQKVRIQQAELKRLRGG